MGGKGGTPVGQAPVGREGAHGMEEGGCRVMDGGMEKRVVGHVGERAERWWWDGWVEAWGDASVVRWVGKWDGGKRDG